MDFAHAKVDRVKVEEFLQRHHIRLVTLLFADMVGSTRLKQNHGDVPAIMRIQEHHAVLRDVLRTFRGQRKSAPPAIPSLSSSPAPRML